MNEEDWTLLVLFLAWCSVIVAFILEIVGVI